MKNKKLKFLLSAGAVTSSISFTNISESIEEESTKYAVTTTNLNFRKVPSSKGKVIYTIKKDTKVEIISYYGKWVKIKYNNTTGYSSKDYLKVLSNISSNKLDNMEENERVGFVTGLMLNVRSGPGTTYQKIGIINRNTQVIVLGSQDGWNKIKLSDGTIGWSSADYIEIK
ncbi:MULTISPECIES: SH3 domain-containing protein [unclassified Romboutsia]|uniref:SH3 domain-containing protein n=1 Tax=unclassified Romboutsia TaxID=2626894 RepID=UPI0008227B28|nr:MULTISPECIES: SH3 domain-containing protein [unclassified Romboutsia]SCI04886.1 invasion associated secreted endopeptidase [uncultured Clostridium sp.]